MAEIKTQIVAVTLYSDRALVTRRGTTFVDEGAQELLLVALPLGLEVDSLRASGRGEVAAKIIGVEARERQSPKASNPSTRETQDELERVGDEGRALVKQDEVLQTRADAVQTLANDAAQRFARTLAQGQIELGRADELFDFVSAQLERINAARADLEVRRRENSAHQVALSNRLKSFQNARNVVERDVSVWIEAAGAGQWELELSYVVPNASWTPIYDARVTLSPNERELAGTLSLGLNALVTQKSGEDWPDAKITLSTARPGLGSLPPKLDAQWIDVERHYPVAAAPMMMRSRGVAGGSAEAAEDKEVTISAPAIEAEEIEAEVATEGATVEFQLPHKLSVPGDGQAHRASIATRELPVKLDYLAVPRRVSLAYLRARAVNDSPLSLLEGAVNVFRDGVFVGKTRLQQTAPGGEFTLFLGPDEQVRASRELEAREVDKSFLGNQRRVHFGFALEVQNLKSHPARLLVQDQIPVSRSENIKVKLRGASEAQVSDLGILSWDLVLAPNEKRTIRFDYGVESPRDTAVVGLND